MPDRDVSWVPDCGESPQALVLKYVEVQYKVGFRLLTLGLREYCTRLNYLSSLFPFFSLFSLYLLSSFFPAIYVAVFHVLSDRFPQSIVFGEIALPFKIPFVYHIVYFFLLFNFLRPVPHRTTPPGHHLTSSLCFDCLIICFVPLECSSF